MKRIISLLCLLSIGLYLNAQSQTGQPAIVYIKLKPGLKNSQQATAFSSYIEQVSPTGLQSPLPPLKSIPADIKGIERIQDIYRLELRPGQDALKVAGRLSRFSNVALAEAFVMPQLLGYTPNDPKVGNQNYLAIIQAFDAWEISKGDTNVVIAVSDMGINTGHDELIDMIAYNYDDPIDGVDNDGDGYTDNFRGWDLGENDNNPMYDVSNHGMVVATPACAEPDNNYGLAGIAFNCRLMPLKIANSSGSLTMSYESIIYATLQGADVVNMSWGAANSYSQLMEEYVKFALDNDVILVAAAGNDNDTVEFYPASYEGVISVAALNDNDTKYAGSGGTTYNTKVDIAAPGKNFCMVGTSYYLPSIPQTSYASPLVAACAAVVRAHFPDYSYKQIIERLRVTADNIDTIAANAPYVEKLGSGRVNLFRALSDSTVFSLRFEDELITDKKNDHLMPGDTVYIQGTYKNYLNTSPADLRATISSTSPYVQVISFTNEPGQLGELDTASNNGDPFAFVIDEDAPIDHEVLLRLGYSSNTDTNFTDYQYFEATINPSFLNISPNEIATTLTSEGLLGYSSGRHKSNLGFVYKNYDNILYEGGLIVGINDSVVSDNIRHDYDFKPLLRPDTIDADTTADLCMYTEFNDDYADSSTTMGIKILLKTYAWTDEGYDNCIVQEYHIINTNSDSLTGIYAGFFADWDIMNNYANWIGYDESRRMAYTYSTESSGLYAGIQLLNYAPAIHQFFDNDTLNYGIVDIRDGFDDDEKYTALTTSRQTSTVVGDGFELVDMLSTGPYHLAAGDTLRIAFNIIAGEHLNTLETTADNIQARYDSIYQIEAPDDDTTDIIQVPMSIDFAISPNPATDDVDISYKLPGKLQIALYDNRGLCVQREAVNGETGTYRMDISALKPGIYFLRLSNGQKAGVRKLVIQ